jgi:hypothetical protein
MFDGARVFEERKGRKNNQIVKNAQYWISDYLAKYLLRRPKIIQYLVV